MKSAFDIILFSSCDRPVLLAMLFGILSIDGSNAKASSDSLFAILVVHQLCSRADAL